MSNTQPALPPLSIPPAYPLYPSSQHPYSYASSVSLPPLSSWGVFTPSSPLRSSSPSPMTPAREREREFATCRCLGVGVRSSPGLELEIGRELEGDEADEAWRGEDTKTTLPGIKSLFAGQLHAVQSGASKPDAFQTQSRYSRQQPTLTDYTTYGCAYDSHADEYLDSEDETHDENDNEDDDSEGLSFTDLDTRATFFRVSAERGRWRYDPQRLPALHRQSAPMASPTPISGLNMPLRPISEPLPSTSTPPPLHTEERSECVLEVLSSVIEVDNVRASSDLGGMHTDVSLDMRVHSPLPPSSPPLSSSPAQLIRSISPLSFAPSSPCLPPSSPLSFFDSLPPSEEQEPELEDHKDGDVLNRDEDDEKPTLSAFSDVGEQLDIVHAHQGAKMEQDPEQTSTSKLSEDLSAHSEPSVVDSDTPDPSSRQDSTLTPLSEDCMSSLAPCTDLKEMELEKHPPACWSDGAGDISAVAVAKELFGAEEKFRISEMEMVRLGSVPGLGEELDEGSCDTSGSSSRWHQEGRARSKLKDDAEGAVGALKTKDENGVDGVSKVGSEKRKVKEGDEEGDAQPMKKARVETTGSAVEKRKAKKEMKRRVEEEENRPAPKQKKQKKSDGDGLTSQKRLTRLETSSSSPASTSKHKTFMHTSTGSSSSKPRLSDETKPKSKLPPLPTKDPETEALHAEIRGMIIESMATSRASCLPASALYKSAMQCRPSLGSQRSEKEWTEVIERVLMEGEAARGGCGIFGKVESSFKFSGRLMESIMRQDESGRPLEAQWFYVPEMDEDQERAALIRSMMPRPAKRSVTKKYKQYYYRPLAKITRWDPEDDL